MTADHYKWFKDKSLNGWFLPPRPFSYRVPIIKNLRYAWDMRTLDSWYGSVLGYRTGYDEWVLYGWWHGLEKDGEEHHEAPAQPAAMEALE